MASKQEVLNDQRNKCSDVGYLYAKYYSKGLMVHIETEQLFMDFVKYLKSIGEITAEGMSAINKKYNWYGGMNMCYITRKILRTGQKAVVCSYPMTSDEDKLSYDKLDTDDGVFSYVVNLDAMFCSEAGSVWFEWTGEGYKAL